MNRQPGLQNVNIDMSKTVEECCEKCGNNTFSCVKIS